MVKLSSPFCSFLVLVFLLFINHWTYHSVWDATSIIGLSFFVWVLHTEQLDLSLSTLQSAFHLWLEADCMDKQQMFLFSPPYDCVDAQYVQICWQKVLCRIVAPFVLSSLHSNFLGLSFYPQGDYSDSVEEWEHNYSMRVLTLATNASNTIERGVDWVLLILPATSIACCSSLPCPTLLYDGAVLRYILPSNSNQGSLYSHSYRGAPDAHTPQTDCME